jgi:hypothetical protein
VQNRNTLERWDVARYDPRKDAWTEVKVPEGVPVTKPWFDDLAVLGDGRVLLVGPWANDLAGVLYDPAKETWTSLGHLPFRAT